MSLFGTPETVTSIYRSLKKTIISLSQEDLQQVQDQALRIILQRSQAFHKYKKEVTESVLHNRSVSSLFSFLEKIIPTLRNRESMAIAEPAPDGKSLSNAFRSSTLISNPLKTLTLGVAFHWQRPMNAWSHFRYFFGVFLGLEFQFWESLGSACKIWGG